MANSKSVINVQIKEMVEGADKVTKATFDLKELGKAVNAASKFARQAHRDLNFTAVVVGVDSAVNAVGQLNSMMADLTAASQVQVEAETKLATVMKQRMGATDAMVESIKRLASAQQEVGIIGDEVQLSGAQQLATFLTQKESLDVLIPAMNNLVAQQKGYSATTGDAVNVGNLMGKVMQGQTSALKRVGISFDEAQEKVLKYGTEAEKAAMLAEVITQNVGSMNEELAKTPVGRLKQLQNSLGDIKEQMGDAIKSVVPFVMAFNQVVMLTGNVAKLSLGVKALCASLKKLGVWAKGTAVSLGSFGGASIATKRQVLQLASALGISNKAAMTLIGSLKGLGAAAAIGAGIALLVGLFNKMSEASEEAKQRLIEQQEAQEAFKRQTRDLTEATAHYAAEEKMHVQQLVDIAKDEERSRADRAAAVRKLQKEYPSYFGSLDAEKIKVKDLESGYAKLTAAILKNAAARAAQDKLLENAKSALEADLGREDARKRYDQQKRTYEALDDLYKSKQKDFAASGATSEAQIKYQNEQLAAIEASRKKAWNDLADTASEIKGFTTQLTTISASNRQLADKIEEGGIDLHAASSSASTSTTKSGTTKLAKAAKEVGDGIIEQLNHQIQLKREEIEKATNLDDLTRLNAELATLQKHLAFLQKEPPINWDKLTTPNVKAEIPKELQIKDGRQPQGNKASEFRQVFGTDKELGRIDAMRLGVDGLTNAFTALGKAIGGAAGDIVSWAVTSITSLAQMGAQLAQIIGAAQTAAQAQGVASASALPFPFNLAAIATVLATLGGIFASMPKFADGGLAFGPTVGLFGEYAGASNNPEVVAPLDRLKSLIGDGGGIDGEVEFKIRGDVLYGILERRNKKLSR